MAKLVGFEEVGKGMVFINPERVLLARATMRGTEILFGNAEWIVVHQPLDDVVFKIWGAA